MPTQKAPEGYEFLGAGGEATVWKLRPGKAAKLYHAKELEHGAWRRHLGKVRCLLQLGRRVKDILCLQGVVWPELLLLDEREWFLGFGMPLVNGIAIHRVFQDVSWNLGERLAAGLQLASCLKGLHAMGLAFGDLSSNNVLLERTAGKGVAVHAIDSDSFHLPGFPCRMGTPRYHMPEVHRGTTGFVPGEKADNHALAFLLFELFLGGWSPFAHKGGGTEDENTAKQLFALGQDKHLVPVGPLLKRWETLPSPIQELFLRAFTKGEQKPVAREWTHLLSSISVPKYWPDVLPVAVVSATTTTPVLKPGRSVIQRLNELLQWKRGA